MCKKNLAVQLCSEIIFSGVTVDELLLDGDTGIHSAAMLYVGCSRVRTFLKLHFTKFAPEAIFCSEGAIEEYNQLRQRALNSEMLPQYDLDWEVNQLPPEYQKKKKDREKAGFTSAMIRDLQTESFFTGNFVAI